MDCVTYKLGDLVKIKYGKNQKKVEDPNGLIPIYGTGGLMGYSSTPLYTKSTVLIGRKGSISKARYIDEPFWCVDTTFYTEINEELVLPKYLYYLLSMTDFMNYNEGTTIPSLRTETLNRLEYDIPSIEDQKNILSVLCVIDDKVNVNNEINRNLSKQVTSVYKSWFIDFERTNGVRPEDWKDAMLGDITDIVSGKRPPMKQTERTEGVQIPLVGAASIMGFTNAVLYSSKILVTGRVGTHGVIQRFNCDCWPSDNTLVITTTRYEFVNQILRGLDYKSMNRGSTQPLITQGDLKKVEIVLPSDKYLDEFETFAGGLMLQVEKNNAENAKLSELRDSLLPKLMSGELDVSTLAI